MKNSVGLMGKQATELNHQPKYCPNSKITLFFLIPPGHFRVTLAIFITNPRESRRLNHRLRYNVNKCETNHLKNDDRAGNNVLF